MISKKVVRIVVLALIVVAIAGIWFFRNQESKAIKEAKAVNVEGEIPLNVLWVELDQLTTHNLPIFIDFGANDCIPCKEMAPVLVKLNKELQGKAVIQFVDVWKNPQAAYGFPVQVIPTQVLMNADGSPYTPSEKIATTIPGFQMYANRETNEHIFTTHQGGLTEEQMLSILEDMGANL